LKLLNLKEISCFQKSFFGRKAMVSKKYLNDEIKRHLEKWPIPNRLIVSASKELSKMKSNAKIG
jgi:hypothetical protein